jgi:hypothetical protein
MEAERFVMALKFHHALSDGLGLMDVFRYAIASKRMRLWGEGDLGLGR